MDKGSQNIDKSKIIQGQFPTFPHRHRTQSERTADAIQSDGGRNLIGFRTQPDRTPNAKR